MNDGTQSNGWTVALFVVVTLLSGVAAAPFLGISLTDMKWPGPKAPVVVEEKSRTAAVEKKPAPKKTTKPDREPRYQWEMVSEETETYGPPSGQTATKRPVLPPRPLGTEFRLPPANNSGGDRSPFESRRSGNGGGGKSTRR